MRKPLITLATLVLLTAMLPVHPTRAGDDQANEKPSSVWMKQKLGASQNILGGLTKCRLRRDPFECGVDVVCRLSGKVGAGRHTGIPEHDERL